MSPLKMKSLFPTSVFSAESLRNSKLILENHTKILICLSKDKEKIRRTPLGVLLCVITRVQVFG